MKHTKIKPVEWPLSSRVEIVWADAAGISGWNDLEDLKTHKPVQAKSVGYLLKADSESVTLIGTQASDNGACQGITIPFSWIREVNLLKPTTASSLKSLLPQPKSKTHKT